MIRYKIFKNNCPHYYLSILQFDRMYFTLRVSSSRQLKSLSETCIMLLMLYLKFKKYSNVPLKPHWPIIIIHEEYWLYNHIKVLDMNVRC